MTISALCALLLLAQPAASDSVATRMQTLADSLLRARPLVPGIVIHVESTRDGRRWTVAAGHSDTARHTPMRPDQPFRIASVTKTYVAAGILRLVERGVISLGDPIEKHIPAHLVAELKRDSIRTDVITMEQLLAHRAGLAEHPSVPSYIATAYSNPRKRWTREEQVRLLVDSLQPIGPPGAQFRYSDTGYVLLGAIIERYTGKTLGLGVRELIGFERLGLRQTWWETLERAPAGVADRAHQYMGGADTYDVDPSIDLYGGGGIVAPIADVAAFMSALQSGKVFQRRATLDTMLAVRSPDLGGYGLGIFRVNSQGRVGIGHTGFWGVLAMHYPAEGLTIAIAVTEQTQGNSVFGVAGATLRAVLPLVNP
ncbi:MAG: serine hydrolase domain-containing protein [Gemmatimonadaceae bacterium]